MAAGVILTLAFAGVEALAGWWSGSLALLPASPRHSFGMARAELVAAFINAAFMLAVVGMLVVEGVSRLLEPVEVKGGAVALVAAHVTL